MVFPPDVFVLPIANHELYSTTAVRAPCLIARFVRDSGVIP